MSIFLVTSLMDDTIELINMTGCIYIRTLIEIIKTSRLIKNEYGRILKNDDTEAIINNNTNNPNHKKIEVNIRIKNIDDANPVNKSILSLDKLQQLE